VTGSPVIRNSHAIKREKKGAGSAISALPPREFTASSDRGHFDQGANYPVALACSNHSRDALRCQPERSETRNTAGDLVGGTGTSTTGKTPAKKYGAGESQKNDAPAFEVAAMNPKTTVRRGHFPPPSPCSFRCDFRVQVAPDSGRTLGRDGRNFLGVRIAAVTYLVRHLWRTNHGARTQENQAATMACSAPYALHRRQVSTLTFLLLFSTCGGRPQGLSATGCV
jgi:hypothetical protein